MNDVSRFKDYDNLIKVVKYVLDNSVGLGVNLQILTRYYVENILHLDNNKWDKEYRKAYMRLYRFLKSLEKEGYIEIRKINGMIWVKANPDRAVDLIFYARKTQTRKIRKRLHEAKYTARKFVEHKHLLTKKDWEYLRGLFDEYYEDTSKRVLVFLSPDREIVIKRYSHRFQRSYLRKVNEKFDRIFANASKKYRIGVFLTLTMDPKKYTSIMEACSVISKAWNRFMSRLRKKFGFRPPYVSVLEFQDNGNPHLHVVIFGVESIGDHFELTEYLKKIGFGEIHYEYQIVNRNGKWFWRNPKKKPSKLRNDGVGDYLKKYIRKIFGGSGGSGSSYSVSDYGRVDPSVKISLYFATDKRFFTYSRCLYKPIRLPKEYGWFYVGSYTVDELPDWIVHKIGYDNYLDLIGLVVPGPP